MHHPNHVEALLKSMETEQIPDLRPLLRFLSAARSSTDWLSSLDSLQSAINKSSVAGILECFIHGVLFECSTEKANKNEDIFASWEFWPISADVYLTTVHHLQLESCSHDCCSLFPDFQAHLSYLRDSSKMLECENFVERKKDSSVEELKIIEMVLGLGLAYALTTSGQKPSLQDFGTVELMILHIVEISSTANLDNSGIQAVGEVLICLLERIKKTEHQQAILKRLRDSRGYRNMVEKLKNINLVDQIKAHLVLVCNQVSEVGSGPDGVFFDDQLEQEQYQKWNSELISCFVLFPKSSAHHVVSTGLLYDAQQRQMIRILNFFSPVLSIQEQNIVSEVFQEILLKLQNLLSQNIASFVENCMLCNLLRAEDFLREICIPQFGAMVEPALTAEGLLKSCLQIYQFRQDLVSLQDTVALLQSLFPVWNFLINPGKTSQPDLESFVQSLEELTFHCLHCISAAKSTLPAQLADSFVKQYRSLDWKLRILFFPSLQSSCSQEDLETLLSPGDLSGSEEAHIWMYKVMEFLLVAVVANQHRLYYLKEHLKQLEELLTNLPEELISWVLVMALVDLMCCMSPGIADRILNSAVPSFIAMVDSERTREKSLPIEIVCRVLFVVGSDYRITEVDRANIVNQLVKRVATLCDFVPLLKTHATEFSLLRAFQEICNVMASMEAESRFETADLQMLSIKIVQDIVGLSEQAADGVVLPSGVALRLVVEWIVSVANSLKQKSRNNIIHATDRIIKCKLTEK